MTIFSHFLVKLVHCDASVIACCLVLQVEMLSHFGSEHFCPLSMLRVFGTTMMEEYEYSESQRDLDKQHQQQQSNGEGAGGATSDGDEESPTIPVRPGESLSSSTPH